MSTIIKLLMIVLLANFSDCTFIGTLFLKYNFFLAPKKPDKLMLVESLCRESFKHRRYYKAEYFDIAFEYLDYLKELNSLNDPKMSSRVAEYVSICMDRRCNFHERSLRLGIIWSCCLTRQNIRGAENFLMRMNIPGSREFEITKTCFEAFEQFKLKLDLRFIEFLSEKKLTASQIIKIINGKFTGTKLRLSTDPFSFDFNAVQMIRNGMFATLALCLEHNFSISLHQFVFNAEEFFELQFKPKWVLQTFFKYFNSNHMHLSVNPLFDFLVRDKLVKVSEKDLKIISSRSRIREQDRIFDRSLCVFPEALKILVIEYLGFLYVSNSVTTEILALKPMYRPSKFH